MLSAKVGSLVQVKMSQARGSNSVGTVPISHGDTMALSSLLTSGIHNV